MEQIIDAHLHFCPEDSYFQNIAEAAGHENTEGHLKSCYEALGISMGVVMGNRGLSLQEHRYPPFLRYCIGLDRQGLNPRAARAMADRVEAHLQRPECVGVKLYPGYQPTYVTDPIYEPVYELAQRYKKPVAVHMGATAGSNALLKYSHPLTLDEAATRHPGVRFIMCHFGNPFLMDAAAVAAKNENVAVDLSGLLEGRVDMDRFFAEHAGYVEALRTWLGYFGYRDVMFGTDWPLVNLGEYLAFLRRLVPEKQHRAVFFENANRIYGLGL